ncbi:MAG TPA: response regulator [Candidatus Acidoferrales bacterium]|nr:response regulator [Candidatus Acidoferrales bacterium]
MLKADPKTIDGSERVPRLPRLLVIDDDEAIRKLLRYRLKDCYDIVDTGSPEDAIAFALEHRPDVILLDLAMPKYSGIEVCGALGSLSFTQKIPIVIVSGAPSDRYKEICENIGAKAYFQKPVDIPALKKTLAQLIAARRSVAHAEAHADPRVKLRIALTLRGTDSHGERFDAAVITENVSAHDFLAPCRLPLAPGAQVEIFLTRNPQKAVGCARVTHVDAPGTPNQRCDFHFLEDPTDWIVR